MERKAILIIESDNKSVNKAKELINGNGNDYRISVVARTTRTRIELLHKKNHKLNPK